MQSTEREALVDINELLLCLKKPKAAVQIVVVVVGKLTPMEPFTMEKRSFVIWVNFQGDVEFSM
jgi:hypothetical protein